MSAPDVSVVMSVYNGVPSIKETVDSITSQEGVDFEFIIINDGSSDESLSILKSIAKNDSRITLINQLNMGLTNALVTGCDQARGKFIARQDSGDVSYPKRLKTQAEYLTAHPDVSMVSCATKFTTPSGEELYTVVQSENDAKQGLRKDNALSIAGPPHHGGVMFRREDYLNAGGYRAAFTVAQDIDLWSRLTEHGSHYSLQCVFYQAVLAKNSISILLRNQQLKATQVIVECMKSRKLKGNDSAVLESYAKNSSGESSKPVANNKTDSAYYYFVGSNLHQTNIDASQRYLRLALNSNQWHWKARIKLFVGFFLKLSNGILK